MSNRKDATKDHAIGISHEASDETAAHAISMMLRAFLKRTAERYNISEGSATDWFCKQSGYPRSKVSVWVKEGVLDGELRRKLLDKIGELEGPSDAESDRIGRADSFAHVWGK